MIAKIRRSNERVLGMKIEPYGTPTSVVCYEIAKSKAQEAITVIEVVQNPGMEIKIKHSQDKND